MEKYLKGNRFIVLKYLRNYLIITIIVLSNNKNDKCSIKKINEFLLVFKYK